MMAPQPHSPPPSSSSSPSRWSLIKKTRLRCVLLLLLLSIFSVTSTLYLTRNVHDANSNSISAADVDAAVMEDQPHVWMSSSFSDIQSRSTSAVDPRTNNDNDKSNINLGSINEPESNMNNNYTILQEKRTLVMNMTSQQQQSSSSLSNSSYSSSPLDALKVPYPIFVASLPKSGTTSIARYFYCGRIWTAHTFVHIEINTTTATNSTSVADMPIKRQMRIGDCYRNNMKEARPVFENCGRYKVYSDMGDPAHCFYPSIHGLQAFYDSYPHATVLLVTRNSTKWTQSIVQWKHGSLLRKWQRCKNMIISPNNTNASSAASDLTEWYHQHVASIQTFAQEHPSLTFVQVSLEDDNAAMQLQEQIGINASCLQHHNSHEKRMQRNWRFRKQYNRQYNP